MDIYKNKQLNSLQGEIWEDVLRYEGLYMVSNLGRIKSLHNNKEKILSQYYGGNKQLMVVLAADGEKNKQYVSNIVGICFIGMPNRKNNEVFTHLNKIKTDNRVCNISIETKSNSVLLNYHLGVAVDWGIKNVGNKTQFVSKQKYIGTDKNGVKSIFTYKELLNKYGSGINSIYNCIAKKQSFKTAYGLKWAAIPL